MQNRGRVLSIASTIHSCFNRDSNHDVFFLNPLPPDLRKKQEGSVPKPSGVLGIIMDDLKAIQVRPWGRKVYEMCD